MIEEILKLVIVGHVDHGKSTLIGRLLFDTHSLSPEKIAEIEKFSKALGRETEFAFLLDHLQEERDQGITIDTTQIFFKTDKRQYIIIDAPGHVEFVKNMITGASQAEAAILLIDAKEGIREQTKRHANILALLGLKQVVVAVNKMDLIGYSQEEFLRIKNEAEIFLNSIGLAAKFYIPLAALRGENIVGGSTNMPWYDGPTILAALDSLQTKAGVDNQPLILPVQDVYRVADKRIFVGRVESGTINQGQKIKVWPEQKTTEVKSIEKFQESEVKIAKAGESVGLTTSDPLFIERGNVISDEASVYPLVKEINANIFWLAVSPLNLGEELILRCATQETLAKVIKIKKRINSSSLEIIETEAQKLENLEVGEVIIETVKSLVLTKFNQIEELGRFILIKNENTCAGGIII